MGKFDLNINNVNIYGIDKDLEYIDIDTMTQSLKEIVGQLDIVRLSLLNINSLLNQSVNKGFVKGARANIFRGWSKKCKSLSISTIKCRDKFFQSYMEDSQKYRMKKIEEKINNITDNIE